MKDRCLNPNNHAYHEYKDRGVCERWLKFENFYEDMGDVPDGMTLERIDNDKGYSPENCRWATYEEQRRNRSDTKLTNSDVIEMRKLHVEGVDLQEIADKYSISRSYAYKVCRGERWPLEDDQ